MKKRTLIGIIGLWIALVPFLGLPQSWKSRLIIVSGLVVSVLALTGKRARKEPLQAQVSEIRQEKSQKRSSIEKAAQEIPEHLTPHQTAPEVKSAEAAAIKRARKPRAPKATLDGAGNSGSSFYRPEVTPEPEATSSSIQGEETAQN